MSDMQQIPDGVSKEIAARLKELQGDLTNVQMAALLGIGRVQWHHIRHGNRAVSYAVAKRAAEHWPEISLIVIRDWTPTAAAAS